MAGIKKYRLLIALILLTGFLPVTGGYAQVLPGVQKDFAARQNANLHEKIFVHINKSFYLTGEILWFKVYCIDGNNNKLLGLSKVAYVELIDENHNAAMQTMIALNGGTGCGSLSLPFSLNSGHYLVRAYTNWMKNFDPGYFFESKISIYNPRIPVNETKAAADSYDVQFMPEGGHLVQGVTSKVVFKVIGSDGKGVDCTGFVITGHGDTLAKFSALRFGMGSFMFTPQANENYKGIVQVKGQAITKDFPKFDLSGYVLHVADDGDRWNVRVQQEASDNHQKIYLILHNNYQIKQVSVLLPNHEGKAEINIYKNKADEGISYLTLFDDDEQPVCERMIFKRPSGKLLIDAKTDEQVYNTRKKVDVVLSTQDEHNSAVPADLSVSVFRADELQNKNPNHITGYLWLRAALKGNIESPDYYLGNTSKEADEALDNLLLSQGWTQFDWANISVASASKFKFLPEYTGPIVTGRVINTTTNKRAPGVTAFLTINGNPQKFYVAKSDSSGRLLFNTQDFHGPHEIVAQTNEQIDSTYHIDIQSPFAERQAETHLEKFILEPNLSKTLTENNLDMQVQNIFANKPNKQFFKPFLDSTWFFGKPTKSYKLDDFTRFTTMEEVLREYVTSIGVAKHEGKFNIKAYNGDQPLGEPLILLDGIPVFDADKVFKWEPLKIKRLDMVSQNYLYGPVLFNGIMSFTTYKGDGAAIEIDPRAVVLDYEGLQMERKFYSPVYDTETQVNNTIPDFRTALYWGPKVNTNTEGKGNLTFYTSDKPGQYVGIIEGITPSGKIGSKIFTFEVKR